MRQGAKTNRRSRLEEYILLSPGSLRTHCRSSEDVNVRLYQRPRGASLLLYRSTLFPVCHKSRSDMSRRSAFGTPLPEPILRPQAAARTPLRLDFRAHYAPVGLVDGSIPRARPHIVEAFRPPKLRVSRQRFSFFPSELKRGPLAARPCWQITHPATEPT